MLKMTRARLLVEMDSAELTEWQAIYTQIEPMPEDRADLRMGITVANLLAPHVPRGAEAPQPKKFIPDFSGEKPKPRQTIDQMKQTWELVCRHWNK